MIIVNKNDGSSDIEIKSFTQTVHFILPEGFLDFFRDTNGAEVSTDENYVVIWPLTDIIGLNKDYNVEEFAPAFFIFGSNGGDMAFAIEKSTGFIFEFPFIGMSNEEAVFKAKTFLEFLVSLEN
jgi:hypothetical protein